MPDRTPRPVDELREQLKALGYLDARLDRFVLGPSHRASSPYTFAIAASARIGALAGLLLGPAAAIGVRLRVPELMTSAADAVVFALYLIVLFGVATTVLAAVGIVAGATLARVAASRVNFGRRARSIAAGAGLLVGLGCLTYLTLWWRATSAAGGSMSLGWSVAALAIAVTISLLLGHVVAATILAVLARLGLAGALAPGLPLSSPRVTGPLGAIALAGAMALLVAGGSDSRDTAPVPTLTVVPTGIRVVVIAVDGADVPTLNRLRAAGQLPALDALLSGSSATITPVEDRDPARVWSTIATGQPPERHGIRSLESRQVAGLEGRLRPRSRSLAAITAATDLLRLTRPAIASGDERRIPAFWEVAARAGLRTAAIHWWATWPAPDDLGIVLTDRAILRLESGGALDGEIAPATLYPALAASWPERRARAAASAADVVTPGTSAGVAAVLRRSAELDALLVDLAGDPALGALDLLTIYLPGLDIAQHALLSDSPGGALAPSDLSARMDSLERYYLFLDRRLAGLAEAAADRVTVLVTQPGRVRTLSAGLVAIRGPVAAVGQRGDAPPTSVAATVLHVLGVPIARDLAAPAVTGLFDAAFLAARPPRVVDTYGTRRPPARSAAGQPLDREMIERMRSLGYVR